MKQITSQMFDEDNGSVKETDPKEIIQKILDLTQRDPNDYKLSAQRVNLMLIRRFTNVLSKSV